VLGKTVDCDKSHEQAFISLVRKQRSPAASEITRLRLLGNTLSMQQCNNL
jgi:hypothetical protein